MNGTWNKVDTDKNQLIPVQDKEVINKLNSLNRNDKQKMEAMANNLDKIQDPKNKEQFIKTYNVLKGMNPEKISTKSDEGGGFKPKEKTVIYAGGNKDYNDAGLNKGYIYQFYNDKWNVVGKNGLIPIDPKWEKIINRLNRSAKSGRDDDALLAKVSEKPRKKDSQKSFDARLKQVKEEINLSKKLIESLKDLL